MTTAQSFPADGQDHRDAEWLRLAKDRARAANWKRWGPYLSERQWGTVREDYSADGSPWSYFPHDHARSRAYRWGEDGLLGICDRECRLCFALALWNGRDPILKERLFGLAGPEGNHGEDCKECYFYLDSTPTHSYMKALYKYPQAAFPYAWLVDENRRRGVTDPEFELQDTGVFDDGRYFDVCVEYAKASPDDVLIQITAANRGDAEAVLHLLPTLWFRNTWAWGCGHEGCWPKPLIRRADDGTLRAQHGTLGRFRLAARPLDDQTGPVLLFTENETNAARLFGSASDGPYTKDAFHEYVVNGRTGAVNPQEQGTKAAAYYHLLIPAAGQVTVRLRLSAEERATPEPFGPSFDQVFADRIREADEFYARCIPARAGKLGSHLARQAYAGLLWSKQFYHYVIRDWLGGDPQQPAPPVGRKEGRNHDWSHLHNRDVVSMPDKWEYPWYAAWDLAFHMLPFARIDPAFAKEQLVLFLREWYMHPSGQLPAYEWALADVNPPVHAWACWRVYKITGSSGNRDRLFLARVFQKLLINFTWWVNRKDIEGEHLFSGGFLGLDNIGVFDRSKPLPDGGQIEQADGTAWMAFYCATMLSMALELAHEDPAYEDVASKFFEHFVAIADAMNTLGGTGLWDEQDGFYYDRLHIGGRVIPTRIRSLVGLIPLCAVEVLEYDVVERLPGFRKRLQWFLENRQDLAQVISCLECQGASSRGRRLLAIPSRARLERVLRYLLDENEFLSPYGVRSMSRFHKDNPHVCWTGGQENRVTYVPGDSDSGMFGGNSNWRGPIWFPVNYLLIEALERYHHFYGDALRVECPTGSGRWMNLSAVACELAARLTRLLLPDSHGWRPCHGSERRFAEDPHWRDLVLFYECFHGDDGRGLGASHQTGWTALVARLLEMTPHHEPSARRVTNPSREVMPGQPV
jgi:Glycosyl hydrolase family 63 C-terminal domain